jgi:DNA-binding NarL/FixJ family response regulator
MRVFIADDQRELRSALRLLIEQEREIEVVGEATEAVSMVAEVRETQPDLILLDWELPGIEPIISPADERRLLSILRSHCPHVEIIALSGRPEAEKEALISGARAFISKGEAPHYLVSALRDIKTQSEKEKER